MLHVLEEAGFPKNAAQYALDLVGGDVALAKAWLEDQDNQVDFIENKLLTYSRN
jgi:hypothetical protein